MDRSKILDQFDYGFWKNWLILHNILKDITLNNAFNSALDNEDTDLENVLWDISSKRRPNWWFSRFSTWKIFFKGSDEFNRHTYCFGIPFLCYLVFASNVPHLDRWDAPNNRWFICFPTKHISIGLHSKAYNGYQIDRNSHGEIVFIEFD